MAIRTIVDLIERDFPAADILDTFQDYASTGAGISINPVQEILKKEKLDASQLHQAYSSLQLGMDTQLKIGNAIDGLEYLQAMNTLAKYIAQNIPVGNASSIQSSDKLANLKSELICAHNHQAKMYLDTAVDTFREHALEINPDTFAERLVVYAKLNPHSDSSPGPVGIREKGYDLRRYGGFITCYNYLQGIHAKEDFTIAELPAIK